MALHVQRFSTDRELVDFANGKSASTVLEMPDPMHLTDEQLITLDDGAAQVPFRVDRAGDGVGGGATAIDISAVANGDKSALATAFAAAVNGSALAATAVADGKYVTLTNDAIGAAGNTAISQDQAAVRFLGANFSGGADAIPSTDVKYVYQTNSNQWLLVWTTP